jgi:Ankyrin repeats (3 copies)
MQYNVMLFNYNSTLQLLNERPYDIPTLPGEPNHDPYRVCFQSMSIELKQTIRQMPPEDQQQALCMIYTSKLLGFRKDLDRMKEIFGDSLDAPLEDPGASQVEELPWAITNAASANNVETVIKWLGPRPVPPERINAKNPDKMDRTLLAEAVYEQHVGLMSYLLQEGAKVDPLNCFGTTPLRQACSMALEKAIRVLLEWGADKDLKESTSAEEYVRTCGNKSLAKLLASPLGGRRCEIEGLQSRVDLNGKTCVLNRYLPDKDRYEVEVERTKENVRVKTANLKRRDRAPFDCGVYYVFIGTNPHGNPMWSINFFVTEAEFEEMETAEKNETTDTETEKAEMDEDSNA